MPRLLSMKSFRTKRKIPDEQIRDDADVVGCTFDRVCDDETVSEDGSSLLSQEQQVTYSPQRSKRITRRIICPSADDDTWLEIIVLLRPDPKTQIRPTKSLYYSIDRKKAYWDEPLSGASRIILSNDVVNPFTRMGESNNNKFDRNVWVKFILSARKSGETRPLLWNCKTHIACWDRAPENASRIISTDFVDDHCVVRKTDFDKDLDDDGSVYSI